MNHTYGLGLSDRRVNVVKSVVVKIHLSVDDGVDGEGVQASRVGCSAVHSIVEVSLHLLLHGGREEAIVLQ